MDSAQAMEAPGLVPTAPSLHGVGPFLGSVILGKPLECADRAAVQDCGAHGVELPGQRGHGGLVQNRQALLQVALEDEDAGLGVATQDPDRLERPASSQGRRPGVRAAGPRRGRLPGRSSRQGSPRVVRGPGSPGGRPAGLRPVGSTLAPVPGVPCTRGGWPRGLPRRPPARPHRPAQPSRERAPRRRWRPPDGPPCTRHRRGSGARRHRACGFRRPPKGADRPCPRPSDRSPRGPGRGPRSSPSSWRVSPTDGVVSSMPARAHRGKDQATQSRCAGPTLSASARRSPPAPRPAVPRMARPAATRRDPSVSSVTTTRRSGTGASPIVNLVVQPYPPGRPGPGTSSRRPPRHLRRTGRRRRPPVRPRRGWPRQSQRTGLHLTLVTPGMAPGWHP